MSTNNMKELGKLHEERFPGVAEQRKVQGEYYLLRHFGVVVDHFTRTAKDMFVNFFGGEVGPKAPPHTGTDPFEDTPPQRH